LAAFHGVTPHFYSAGYGMKKYGLKLMIHSAVIPELRKSCNGFVRKAAAWLRRRCVFGRRINATGMPQDGMDQDYAVIINDAI